MNSDPKTTFYYLYKFIAEFYCFHDNIYIYIHIYYVFVYYIYIYIYIYYVIYIIYMYIYIMFVFNCWCYDRYLRHFLAWFFIFVVHGLFHLFHLSDSTCCKILPYLPLQISLCYPYEEKPFWIIYESLISQPRNLLVYSSFLSVKNCLRMGKWYFKLQLL